jgi:hypothetical protein
LIHLELRSTPLELLNFLLGNARAIKPPNDFLFRLITFNFLCIFWDLSAGAINNLSSLEEGECYRFANALHLRLPSITSNGLNDNAHPQITCCLPLWRTKSLQQGKGTARIKQISAIKRNISNSFANSFSSSFFRLMSLKIAGKRNLNAPRKQKRFDQKSK